MPSPTYFKLLLRNDTQSPTRKSMGCDPVELHSPSDSPFRELVIDIHLIFKLIGNGPLPSRA